MGFVPFYLPELAGIELIDGSAILGTIKTSLTFHAHKAYRAGSSRHMHCSRAGEVSGKLFPGFQSWTSP